MRYAFVNQNGIVVNITVGVMTEEQQAAALRDHRALFGADRIIEVADDTTVWIGGSYTDGEFLPPPAPEPEPAPEPLPEPLPEPQTEPEA